MKHRVALDQPHRDHAGLLRPLLVAAVVALACRPGVAPIAPAVLPPLDRTLATAWVDSLLPPAPRRYDVRWTVETQKGQVRGRASARVVPPDSLRFDYRAPFGRSGAAVLIGDSLLWAKPEERNPVPPAPLFWAALGIALHPPPDAAVSGRALAGELAWRYAFGRDTLTYVISTSSGTRLRALFRRDGDVVGTVETSFDGESHLPTQAKVLFPHSGALFLMSVQDVEVLASVDPSMWKEP